MTVFGRRAAPTRLLCTLVILMGTATGQTEDKPAICEYKEQDGWARFGESSKDVCEIAQELMGGTCALPFVPSLNITHHSNLENAWYTASRFDDDAFPPGAKKCICDRVMFNLLSACAGCQKWEWSNVTTKAFKWQTFEFYKGDACHNIKTMEKRAVDWIPQPPAWAISFNEESFNATKAQPPNDTPEAPVSASASPSSTNPVAKASLAATGDVAQSAVSSSGPPIGAIVGGVIGGLVFLGAIAGLAYWLHCRKRRARDIAPSSEFLKPEYYATPPLLPAHERRDSAYRDEMEEEMGPSPTSRLSWAGGLVTTRRHEDDDEECEMLPPFTRGAYIGPSPHEKGHPERRDTGDTDITIRTNNTTAFLLSSASPTRRPGPSEYYT
ncbi:hypothetical protein B0J17DRAFT_648624 [Rhizoctonia solani]|nr:hypothetical protein B0J17DRAFT_648624 [Rhizoctonia solani]